MNKPMDAVVEELKKCFEEAEKLVTEGQPGASELYDDMLSQLDEKIKELKQK